MDKKSPSKKKKFTKRDAAKETNASRKEVAKAWHQARNDYQDSGSPFGKLDKRKREEKKNVPMSNAQRNERRRQEQRK